MPGVAVLSSRRLLLGARLLRAGVGARFVLPQSADPGAQLPPIRPPLLLDTPDLGWVSSATLLVELARRRAVIPTIALMDPADRVTAALLGACPCVYAVVADTEDLAVLGPLIRLGGACGGRAAWPGPLWVGAHPPDHGALTTDGLMILVALAHARSIPEAASRVALSERTFYRRLAALRESLGLPPGRFGTRTDELLRATLDAMAGGPPSPPAPHTAPARAAG